MCKETFLWLQPVHIALRWWPGKQATNMIVRHNCHSHHVQHHRRHHNHHHHHHHHIHNHQHYHHHHHHHHHHYHHYHYQHRQNGAKCVRGVMDWHSWTSLPDSPDFVDSTKTGSLQQGGPTSPHVPAATVTAELSMSSRFLSNAIRRGNIKSIYTIFLPARL